MTENYKKLASEAFKLHHKIKLDSLRLKNLIDIDALLEKKHEPQINNYINVLKKRDEAKYTHCFNCKEDINSIDFTICDSCKGIRCTCSACFCEWKDYIDY